MKLLTFLILASGELKAPCRESVKKLSFHLELFKKKHEEQLKKVEELKGNKNEY